MHDRRLNLTVVEALLKLSDLLRLDSAAAGPAFAFGPHSRRGREYLDAVATGIGGAIHRFMKASGDRHVTAQK